MPREFGFLKYQFYFNQAYTQLLLNLVATLRLFYHKVCQLTASVPSS